MGNGGEISSSGKAQGSAQGVGLLHCMQNTLVQIALAKTYLPGRPSWRSHRSIMWHIWRDCNEGESLPLATKHIIYLYIYVHIDTYVVWCSVYLYNFIYTGTYHIYLQLETVFFYPSEASRVTPRLKELGARVVCGASASWSSHGNLSFLIRNDEEWLSMIKKYWGWYDDEGWLWMMENH